MYIKKLAGEYEISEEAMLSEVMRRTRPASRQSLKIANAVEIAKRAGEAEHEIDEKIYHNERFILSLLCVDNSIYPTVKEHFKIDQFSGEENRRIAEIIYGKLNEKKDFSPAELMNIVSPETAGKFALILKEECHCDDNSKAILGKMRDIKILSAEKRQRQVLELLKDPKRLPEGDVDKLKLELKSLILRIKDLKNTPI